jgi:hypothetical protein
VATKYGVHGDAWGAVAENAGVAAGSAGGASTAAAAAGGAMGDAVEGAAAAVGGDGVTAWDIPDLADKLREVITVCTRRLCASLDVEFSCKDTCDMR